MTVKTGRWNIWLRIADFFLDKIEQEAIEEFYQIRSYHDLQQNLLTTFFDEKQKLVNVAVLWRFVYTKILMTLFDLLIYFYNDALFYFFDMGLRVPPKVAVLLGEPFSEYLLDEDNHFWLFTFYGIMLAWAVQLLITAVAWHYKDTDLEGSVICYTCGGYLALTFLLNFVILHRPEWEPPSSLAYTG